MRCNHFVTPLGYQIEDGFHLSWAVDCDDNDIALETRVEIATNESFTDMVSVSLKSRDIDNLCYRPAFPLKPQTRYYWCVHIYTEGIDVPVTTAQSWFETAKQGEPWAADWITPAEPPERHPILFNGFQLGKAVKSARAYICGLGVYYLKINGKKAGNEYLSPGLCAYDLWLPYQTYDVTEMLGIGANIAEVELGNGWYKGRYGLSRTFGFKYGEEFACICEIDVTFEDGGKQLIKTDLNWMSKLSAITDSSIFDGEHRDDTLPPSEPLPVKIADISKELLQPRRTQPLHIMHEIKPIELIRTPAGEIVLDMGQNMVGLFKFKCAAPNGKKIHLQFGEILQNGNFYRDNLRTALCEYTYVSDGAEKTVCQLFTYYGFRYVKLTEWYQDVNQVDLNDFTGLVLYTDIPQTGYIKTSNEKVNKLIANALWGQRGNFLDVPTDCPQRDERMGWTGDAQVIFGASAFNMDVASLFSKFCYDLKREQENVGGTVPVVIPKHDVGRTGACAWGDAAAIIPWNHYVMYGDVGTLRRQYPSMKAWVDHIRRQDEKAGGNYLWKGDFHFGDWLALDVEDSLATRFGGTEHTYLASCFYRHSARLTAKAARVLGEHKEADYYENLSESVRAAILREYMTETGRLAVTTQTAHILALHFDIVPEQFRERTAHSLSIKLKESNFHLRTGFIGTPYLCRVLSDTGYNNIAYRLLLQEDFPSWLYAVNLGATTIWERWNSVLADGSISDTGMNSLNHYAYGSIVEWIYRDIAGINPIEEYPGFRKFRLTPKPDPLLGSVAAEYNSRIGKIKSAWRYLENGAIELKFTVPYGSTAYLTLPDCATDPEKELAPGDYTFRYLPASSAYKLNMDTPLSELKKYPAALEVMRSEITLPMMYVGMFTEMAGQKSLRDFSGEKPYYEGYFNLTTAQAEEINAKMSDAAKNG
jgi:alpha-L-rhamnosidase